MFLLRNKKNISELSQFPPHPLLSETLHFHLACLILRNSLCPFRVDVVFRVFIVNGSSRKSETLVSFAKNIVEKCVDKLTHLKEAS